MSGSLPLACLRVAVALTILTLPQVHAAPGMWVTPVQYPLGTGWLVPYLSASGAGIAWWGVVLGAIVGGIGLSPRLGFGAVVVFGTYLLAIPQIRGGVQHYHHLLWFSALLAASPCADALSPWSWRPTPGRSLGWGVPLRISWGILASIFFFPGLHKLLAQGPAWAGDNLRWLLLWKWAQSWAFVPLFRLDLYPNLLSIGGLLVLAFEIGAPLAMGWWRSRLAFGVLALVFHAATALLFDIDFRVLIPCYVVLLPFGMDEPEISRDWRPAAAVSAVLFVGIVGTGLFGVTQGWPFACYPAFERPVGRWMPTMQLVAVDARGTEHPIPERLLVDPVVSQAFYGEVWGLSGLYGVDDPTARRAFWERVRRRPGVEPAGTVEVRFYRADLDVETGEIRRGDRLR